MSVGSTVLVRDEHQSSSSARTDAGPLLSLRNLKVEFGSPAAPIRAVRNLSLEVQPGEIVALVGESGSGKSVSALSVVGLLPEGSARVGGEVIFDGRDLLKLNSREMQTIRGREIAMIFQEPMTSLNPVLTIGLQVTEALRFHLGMNKKQADARALELMEMVGIPDAVERLDQYPHQFSGGMRQRVMIAIGLACNPRLIIADEPTTALDVTIQAQILELMRDLSSELGIALIIITHNLGIVARYADKVLVMYAGEVAEKGSIDTIFKSPCHPYTLGLLRSVPRLDQGRQRRLNAIEGLPPDPSVEVEGCQFKARCPFCINACDHVPTLEATDAGSESACFRKDELAQGALVWNSDTQGEDVDEPVQGAEAILRFDNVTMSFNTGRGGLLGGKKLLRAVSDLSLSVYPGETLGLVGESGCGKSTVGRLALGLEVPTDGMVSFGGRDISHLTSSDQRAYRRDMQVVFQDPYSSLNPRMKVGNALDEPMAVHGLIKDRTERWERVLDLLDQVGLRPEIAARYPHQLSGGQRQRVGIARAIALEPKFIVCDEAVSALDVSIQGQVLNLLQELQRKHNLTYLFIAHDLAVVRHLATRVAVMYLGRLMEVADRDELYASPLHPYTQLLLNAAPIPDPEVERSADREIAKGELPSPTAPPPGCVFHTRCPLAVPECAAQVPKLEEKRPGHFAACIKI